MDYFDTLTIFDAVDLKESGKFCIEDIIELLGRVVSCIEVEKRGKSDIVKQLYLRHLFEKA